MRLFEAGVIVGLGGLLALIMGFTTGYNIFTETRMYSVIGIALGGIICATARPR